jgi:hypothetical protein
VALAEFDAGDLTSIIPHDATVRATLASSAGAIRTMRRPARTSTSRESVVSMNL